MKTVLLDLLFEGNKFEMLISVKRRELAQVRGMTLIDVDISINWRHFEILIMILAYFLRVKNVEH